MFFLTLQLASEESDHRLTVNFQEIKASEFVKFISKITKKTFVYQADDLDFMISFISGETLNSKEILAALFHLLEQRKFKIKETPAYFIIEKHPSHSSISSKTRQDKSFSKSGQFHIYKLQYQKGAEILATIKQLAASAFTAKEKEFQDLVQTMHWIESTNSLVFNSSNEGATQIEHLIQSLDTPQKQVFIEVLVIETDAKEASEFGLEWGGGGKYKDRLGLGFGSFSGRDGNFFAQNLQGISATSTPSGTNQFPLGKGFDLGVIGDLIFHKGRTFLSLGSLISALEKDGKISVILNQKILTQDNKSSSIFVGDNIPFTGSVVQTVGASQQTTANIEYRDVGVSLKITPLLGDGEIITLEIDEEITEARDDLRELESRVNGIQTTKTNMSTRVHVPDQHFLVLSGMVKNSRITKKTGIPCLGGLPLIGALFSKNKVEKEKKNILIFVRPQIIHSFDHYKDLSNLEEARFQKNLDQDDKLYFEKQRK